MDVETSDRQLVVVGVERETTEPRGPGAAVGTVLGWEAVQDQALLSGVG